MAKKAEADVDVAAPEVAALNGVPPKTKINGYMSVFPGETQGFVKNYPYHGFIIDIAETKKLGLSNVSEITNETQIALDLLLDTIGDNYLIGNFYTKEVTL